VPSAGFRIGLMHRGTVIDRRLRFVDPFREP
jgi:hypothetical protein